MTHFLSSCIKANEEIYLSLAQPYPDEFFKMGKVGAGGDESSGLDMFAEAVFVKHLDEYGQIESEESGLIGEERATTIIIDPIDGSSNALSYFPYFGTSVAKLRGGVVDTAMVCNLANGDYFIKDSGGEVLQGKLFRDRLEPPVVAPASPIGLFEKAYNYPKLAKELTKNGLKFRSSGAVALSLAYAQSVKYLLFMGKYRKYDFVAGLALCDSLEVIIEDDYVIVSKEKKVAKRIRKLIKQSYKGE